MQSRYKIIKKLIKILEGIWGQNINFKLYELKHFYFLNQEGLHNIEGLTAERVLTQLLAAPFL